ncbi:MAG TPA: class I SAM-dependent methyltransferase [Candidatus Binatia bacterium]|nr:class I SAM-dependent methyltransferase [Candidatus Binatia bacterium]
MSNQITQPNTYLLGLDKSTLRRYALFDEIYQPATAERFATLPVSADMNVLEVGCGIGDTACYLAKQVVPNGYVVAFDQSRELVELARQRAAAGGIDNLEFVCARAQEFQFDKECFDLVHTRFVLSYMRDAKEIVAKIYAALKVSGIFLGEEIFQAYIKHNEPKWFRDITTWFARLIEMSGGNPDYGLAQLPSDMLEAGFKDLKVTAQCPVRDQARIAEMLRLALANEMRKALVDAELATDKEIDDDVSEMMRLPENKYISVCMVAQVSGSK